MQTSHDFQAECILVGPVFVDGSFADSGRFRNRIHAGRIDAALRKQLERPIQNLIMSARASLAGHC
jgi:hypothetical protein